MAIEFSDWQDACIVSVNYLLRKIMRKFGVWNQYTGLKNGLNSSNHR